MADFNFKYAGGKVVLTEGKNDCHVILSLCKRHDVPETFGLYECGSDDKGSLKNKFIILRVKSPA